ncbi:MAG: hypothetical protein V1708_05170 [Candidatus Micrarchaeota archaeon]
MALFGLDDSTVVFGALLLVVLAWTLSEWRLPWHKDGGEIRI